MGTAHLLNHINQAGQNQALLQNQNHLAYPPLYLQGPHGMYYVLVPPPNRYIADYPGSVGDLSDNESSDDCESLGDRSDTDITMTEMQDNFFTENLNNADNFTKYDFKNNFEDINKDETADNNFEMQSDEQLT